jgi:hypothetical protein
LHVPGDWQRQKDFVDGPGCPEPLSKDNRMNVDHILKTFNRHQVAYLLIGGMNFLLRHRPVLTYGVDVWIDDDPENLVRTETALADLRAEWGSDEEHWGPVAQKPPGWLAGQRMLCLSSPAGTIHMYRAVSGLESWADCFERAVDEQTPAGTPYLGLADADMLRCQTALPAEQQNAARVQFLRRLLEVTADGIAPPADSPLLEEQKRESSLSPLERWQALQDTITSTESQAAVGQSATRKCLELQQGKLALMSQALGQHPGGGSTEAELRENLVTIATFTGPADADPLQAVLEEAGIRCCLQDEITLGMMWPLSNAAGGVKLLVLAADVERAKAILTEAPSAAEVAAGQEPDDKDVSRPDVEGDKAVARAFRAAILGIALLPLLLAFYSAWILLRLAVSGQPLSPAGRRKFYVTLAVDLIVAVVTGMSLLALFGRS